MKTAIVVLGNGRRRLRDDGISKSCLTVVREAERVAGAEPVDVVVFTGGSRGNRTSEAEHMSAAWRGPEVELVIEPTAVVTAQNASRSLPLLLERGIEKAIVVCAPLHLYRARFFFSRLYGPRGIETVFQPAPVARRPRAAVWELGAASVIRRQLRAAQAELRRRSAP
jgi:uncharacterized SAM-binding protein YcdF (DUF218 family)